MLKYLAANPSGEENFKWTEGRLDGQASHYFEYRKQQERLTAGIWVYSQPFVRNDTAIILMDTQGLFDLQTPPDINKVVFSISTLISSYQILNIQNRISEDALEQLQFFSEFARSAIELTNEQAEEPMDIDKFKFQHLEFLIRDYVHYEFEDEDDTYEKCVAKMKKFLENTFAQDSHDMGTREQIMSTFESVTCMGFPFPGKVVNSKKWDGDLSHLDDDFLRLVTHYFILLFEKNLTVKNPLFPEQKMSPHLWATYIESFVKVFQSGQLPEAVNLSTAFSANIHLNAKEEAEKLYNKTMKDLFFDVNEYKDSIELDEIHKKAEAQCHDVFNQKSRYGKKEDREKIWENLKTQLTESFNKAKEVNKARMSEILAKY
eukprot:UN25535